MVKFVLFIIFLAILGSLPEDKDDAAPFRNKGYFKDTMQNRIVSIELLKTQYKDSEIINWAKRTQHTPGQITQVYFYPKGSVIPSDGLTLDATSVFDAHRMMYDLKGLSKWQYVYATGLIGESTLIKCKEDPKNGLCRQ